MQNINFSAEEQALLNIMVAHKLEIQATVEQKESVTRSYNQFIRRVHWRYSLLQNGKEILTGPFFAPEIIRLQNDDERNNFRAIKSGVSIWLFEKYNAKPVNVNKQKLAIDIFRCLCSDARCVDGTFEDFCGDFGYETDSRKALETYLTCQNTLNVLRRAIGVKALEAAWEV